jgi:hypothetical protein
LTDVCAVRCVASVGSDLSHINHSTGGAMVLFLTLSVERLGSCRLTRRSAPLLEINRFARQGHVHVIRAILDALRAWYCGVHGSIDDGICRFPMAVRIANPSVVTAQLLIIFTVHQCSAINGCLETMALLLCFCTSASCYLTALGLQSSA